jgi:hypothetical protein
MLPWGAEGGEGCRGREGVRKVGARVLLIQEFKSPNTTHHNHPPPHQAMGQVASTVVYCGSTVYKYIHVQWCISIHMNAFVCTYCIYEYLGMNGYISRKALLQTAVFLIQKIFLLKGLSHRH